jgi:hypothetical protein
MGYSRKDRYMKNIEDTKNRNTNKLIVIIIIALLLIIITMLGILILGNSKSGDSKIDISKKEVFIDHPIVGTWAFNGDYDGILNSNWKLTFNADGTYTSVSDGEDKEGSPMPLRELYASGTYEIVEGGKRETLKYYHSVHEKYLDTEFIIEEIEGKLYLTMYMSMGKERAAGYYDGARVNEVFVKETD